MQLFHYCVDVIIEVVYFDPVLKLEDLCILTLHGTNKSSWHIIVPGYHTVSAKQPLLIVQLVRKYQLERSPEQQHLDMNNQQSLYNNEPNHCENLGPEHQVTPNKSQFGHAQDHHTNMETQINDNSVNHAHAPRPIS